MGDRLVTFSEPPGRRASERDSSEARRGRPGGTHEIQQGGPLRRFRTAVSSGESVVPKPFRFRQIRVHNPDLAERKAAGKVLEAPGEIARDAVVL